MDYSHFNSLMINGIIEKWLIFLIILAVAVAHEIYYIHKKNCSKKENKEMRIFGNILFAVAAIAFLDIAGITIPMVRDVVNEDYIEIHGEYSLDAQWYESNDDRWVHIDSDDGRSIDVKFPGYSHGGSKLFPSGEFTGTVW